LTLTDVPTPQPLAQLATHSRIHGCTTYDVMMYCVRQTMVARSFTHKRGYLLAKTRCFAKLPTATKTCQITELALHHLFMDSASKTAYVNKRQALMNQCHTCVAVNSNGLVASPPTPAPTPASAYVSACERRCATIVNARHASRVFSDVCARKGADVCGDVRRKELKMPTAYAGSNSFPDKQHDACFCMRHCFNLDSQISIKCAPPSIEWPQRHSEAEVSRIQVQQLKQLSATTQLGSYSTWILLNYV
jgi:hypothetical protein